MDEETRRNKLEEIFKRMHARYKEKKHKNVQPTCVCEKCGASNWEKDDENGAWYCFICSNRGHWDGDEFIQYRRK